VPERTELVFAGTNGGAVTRIEDYEAGGGLATDVDKNGETALHGAIYRAGSIAIAKFLIDKGSKLDVRRRNGPCGNIINLESV
jgi:ankyrin repeat protein